MVDRFRTAGGGNTSKFLEMASELVNLRSQQGKGKAIKDGGSFSAAGNPKAFFEMAAELSKKVRIEQAREL
ncbi:MAG: hypothetical protein HC921_16060 [Synechococcaceae cyanobacterium SM2_3_1]|nr:hypothetical protein [Synechococcaceae cyanobacterium SM2_3_1]